MVSIPFPHPASLFNTSNFILILLGLVSIIGDYIVAHTKLHLFQALFDNATHSVIGGLSWFYVSLQCRNRATVQALIEVAICASLASLIDVDHFVSARSWYLKDATSLQKRPPLHCTTFPVLFSFVVFTLSYFFRIEMGKKMALIVLTAFLSHHVRDATRRGFWLYPFGSSPPLSYSCYVAVTCFIPILISYLNKICVIERDKFHLVNKGSVI